MSANRWEHFSHAADIGIRGLGDSRAAAFEQAALAMTAAVADLDRTEEHGVMRGADPATVSDHAKRRQRDEMGTLGSGYHHLEVQHAAEIFDEVSHSARKVETRPHTS